MQDPQHTDERAADADRSEELPDDDRGDEPAADGSDEPTDSRGETPTDADPLLGEVEQ